MNELDELLDALDRWVPALLPDPKRAAVIAQRCRAAADHIDRSSPFAEQVAAVERAAHTVSRHLLLFVDPSGSLEPSIDNDGWPPPDLRAIRRRAGGVRSVERAPDGVAMLVVDQLDPFDVAEPFLEAAAALCSRATGLVLDLRNNGGGDPQTVAFLASYVLGPGVTPLSTVFGADIVEWSTMGFAASACVTPGAPVAVLVGPATFSSGEALAYHLQVRGRVRVFGQTTPGAADHVTPIVLTHHVHAQLPVARVVDAVSGSSWEAVGVTPDVSCPLDRADERALDWIRQAFA